MNERGQYGRSYDRVGAEPPPVRQVLIDALAKLRSDRQALAVRIQEDEKRLKIALDLQRNFEQPITSDVLLAQFEALQRESSTRATGLAAATRSLANIEKQIQEVSERIEKVIGRPASLTTRPIKPPSRPRREVREEPREESPAKVTERIVEPAQSSDKTVLYGVGAVAVVVVLGIALSQMGD